MATTITAEIPSLFAGMCHPQRYCDAIVLRLSPRKPWRTDANLAVADHNVPTTDRAPGSDDPVSRLQIETLDSNCTETGIVECRMNDPRQGIVHVVGPEQGATQQSLPGWRGDAL